MISHSQIEAWLKKYKIKGYVINPDGTVDVYSSVDLSRTGITSFPFQFRKVGGSFLCHNTEITSLQGAPQSVGGGFFCSGTKITSLQGAPQSVGSGFFCYDTHITSLSGVEKIIKQMNGRFETSESVTHVLGLILIPGITKVYIARSVDQIMNKYVGTGDILSCQDELIDAGFVEQARL